MSDIVLRPAETDAEVADCFPVMAQLRPHLASAEELVARVARQRETGYCILAAWCDDKPVALAGYRVQVNLIYGKFLYVDDLVTEADRRRSGLGASLLDALAIEAGSLGCERRFSIPLSTTCWRTASITARACSHVPCASGGRWLPHDDDPANPRQPASAFVQPTDCPRSDCAFGDAESRRRDRRA